MKKTIISLCVATVFSTQAADVHHVHTAHCADAIKASPFTVTIDELKSRVMATTSQTSLDTDVVVDLMAFYQPSYADKMGEQWVHQRIQKLVDNTNTGLANSGIKATIRLVNAQPITGIPDDLHYSTSADGLVYGAGTIASARIQNPYENFPENAIYEAMGADLAVYIRDYNADLQPENSLGFGSLGGELSTVFDTATLPTTDPLHPQGEYVLAHELGHNFEAGHLTDDGGFTFLPAAHAYTCAGRTTIMGPADPNGHRFYSSPSKVVNGEACGIEGVADNTSVIKEHIPLAAERRSAPVEIGTVSLLPSYTINPGDAEAVITVNRTGDLSQEASVQVALFDDTAKEGRDFLTSFERVVFEQGNSSATFTVKLSQAPKGTAKIALRYPHKLEIVTGESTLVLSEEPAKVGTFGFEAAAVTVAESVGTVSLKINRTNGADTEHAVRVYTEDRERKAGVDYVAFDQVLVFAAGETQKSLTIEIKDNDIVDANGTFVVKLDGQGAELAVSDFIVTLTNNDVAKPTTPDSNSGSSGGSMSWFFMLLLTLTSVFRVVGKNANKKPV